MIGDADSAPPTARKWAWDTSLPIFVGWVEVFRNPCCHPEGFMGDHLGLERYYWFDAQVHAGLFPNAATLAGQFEISSKTAQRSIDFMRDRFGAPLEYDPSRKGYRYSDESFSRHSRFPRRRWSQSFWRETSC